MLLSLNQTFALDAFVTDYDVVVIGEDGIGSVELDKASLFAALNNFITLGGGVVSTGFFAGYTFNAAGGETISPVGVGTTGGVKAVAAGSPITVTPLDADGVAIAGGITGYAAQGFHEYALSADANAKVLATTEANDVAIAYYNGNTDGVGRTVYLGSLHMASDHPQSRVDGTDVDALFERAVVWAAGGGASAPIVSSVESDFAATDTLAFATPPVDATLI
jgi:hypothetical protein